ncbi:MAG: hypothetical protein ACOCW6_05010 [Spirochaetota bacterium]
MYEPRSKQSLFLLLLFFLLFSAAGKLFSLTVEAEFDIGNLGFSTSRDADTESLPVWSYPWGFRAAVGETISENLAYKTGVERDFVIRNFAFLQFQHQINTLTLGAGPTFGFLSSPGSPGLIRPGLAGYIRWNLYSFGYVSLDALAPLYSPSDEADDFYQARRRLQMGFYLPNVITTFSVSKREFILTTESGEEADALVEYATEAEVFQKNIPYRIALRFAYQDYRKFFEEPGTTGRHALGALVFGTGVRWDLKDNGSYYINLDSSVYTFGRLALLGEFSDSAYFFRAQTGFVYSLRD